MRRRVLLFAFACKLKRVALGDEERERVDAKHSWLFDCLGFNSVGPCVLICIGRASSLVFNVQTSFRSASMRVSLQPPPSLALPPLNLPTLRIGYCAVRIQHSRSVYRGEHGVGARAFRLQGNAR